MSYWSAVLAEIVNKHDPKQRIAFTNVREYCPLPVAPSPKKKLISSTALVMQLKKYPVGKKYPQVYFTQREAQVMFYLLRGFSNKRVSILLQLSARTVEFYINNMKTKLNCRFKSDLLTEVAASEFLQGVNVDFTAATTTKK